MFVNSQKNKKLAISSKVGIQKYVFDKLKYYKIDAIWEWIINLLYPRHCPVCDDIVKYNKGLICPSCDRKINVALEYTCMRCGKELKDEGAEYCYACKMKTHEFKQGKIGFPYEVMRGSLYRYKYMGRAEYGLYYGRILAEKFGKQLAEWKVEAIVPVPLHKSKLRKRGYNQAEILAEVIGEATGITVKRNWVKRCKKTVPQKGLDGTERQNNLKKAFKIVENDVKLETIVIIDDIYTTGSTIDAIAKVCKVAGVKNVYFLALAAGLGY